MAEQFDLLLEQGQAQQVVLDHEDLQAPLDGRRRFALGQRQWGVAGRGFFGAGGQGHGGALARGAVHQQVAIDDPAQRLADTQAVSATECF